jgi:hypothetical protein
MLTEDLNKLKELIAAIDSKEAADGSGSKYAVINARET